jgi:release factor glutamine methyltransferase
MITIGEALEWGHNFLVAAGFEDPGVEVRALLGGLLNTSPVHLHLQRDQMLEPVMWKRYQSFVGRRSTHEPVAYILGRANFRGLDFDVKPAVLIPRPETEILVEQALSVIRSEALASPRILDLGTGSGCIAVSLAAACPEAEITALDVSPEALEVARGNAEKHDVAKRIFFTKSDLFEWFRQGKWGGYFDMIVANPPYISSAFLSHLAPDLNFEPKSALDGGPDGLFVIRPLVKEAPTYLKPTGVLMLEIGFDQGEPVRELFEESGFRHVDVRKDDARWDRIVSGWLSHRTAPDHQLLLGV